MHKYNFVGINIQRIDGVINPILTVQGIIDKKKFKFIVEADGENIEYNLLNLSENGDFNLTAPLKKDNKLITVFVVVDNKKYELFTMKIKLSINLSQF